jgi:hypothetical protein
MALSPYLQEYAIGVKRGVIHVWKSASKSGETKTPKFKRSLELIRELVLDLTRNCQPPTGHPANDPDERRIKPRTLRLLA